MLQPLFRVGCAPSTERTLSTMGMEYTPGLPAWTHVGRDAEARKPVMRVIIVACAFAALSFLIHWSLWRIRVPRRQTITLLVVFTSVLSVGLMACSGRTAHDLGLGLQWPWEYVQVVMFHVASTLGYIVAYSAIEHRSPSMAILTFVADAGGDGRSRQEVEQLLRNGSPLHVRIEAMLRDGMVRRIDGDLALTRKGSRWAAVFGSWANLIGVGKGG